MIYLLLFIVYAIALNTALALRSYRAANSSPAEGAHRKRPERILIVGATGGTGRQLVEQALERGYAVTAFVRNPSKISLKHPKLSVLRGDVVDAASVEAAMKDQQAVLSALGHKNFFYPTRILSQGTANILRSMKIQGVSRIVCQTSLGIGDNAGRMGLLYTLFTIPVILPFYFWDKTRQERIVACSDTDWTIVRPGALTNGKKRGRVRHATVLGNFLWTVSISRADSACFMLDQLESDLYLRKAVSIAS